MSISTAFYVVGGLVAMVAVLAAGQALSIPSYGGDAALLKAMAWTRALGLLGGAMVSFFAAYVCEKLNEITQILRKAHVEEVLEPPSPESSRNEPETISDLAKSARKGIF